MIPNPERQKAGGPQLGARTAGEPGPFGRRPDDDNQQQEEEEPVPSLVNDRVQQQINAARARRDRQKAQRQALDTARQAGLARRHAQKLRHLNQREQDEPPPDAA